MKKSIARRIIIHLAILFCVVGALVVFAVYSLVAADNIPLCIVVVVTSIVTAVAVTIMIVRRSLQPIDGLMKCVDTVVCGVPDGADGVTPGMIAGCISETYPDRESALRALKKKMCETERLARLGQLAAGVAHELNNPLGGIIVYAHLLKEDTESDDPRYPNIGKIIKEANRCRIIVKSLLDFARQGPPMLINTNVNSVVEDALANIRNEQSFDGVTVRVNLESSLPLVEADPSQIQEVFENIIRNAAEVIDGTGELMISSHAVNNENGCPAVEVVFEDTGPGIPDENMGHIFDPFYTTKLKGHGTGLGLAVSYGIVERHRGAIVVRNRSEGGASFSVKLPVGGPGA